MLGQSIAARQQRTLNFADILQKATRNTQQGYVDSINTAQNLAGGYRPTQTAGYNALDTLSDLLGISRPTAGYANYTDTVYGKQGQAQMGVSPTLGSGKNSQNSVIQYVGSSQGPIQYSGGQAGQAYTGGWTDPTQASQSAMAALANTPGYQFSRDQGNQSIQRLMNSKGLWGSGNMATAMSDYNQKLAGQTYQNAIQNYSNLVSQGNAATSAANSLINSTQNNAVAAMADWNKAMLPTQLTNAYTMTNSYHPYGNPSYNVDLVGGVLKL